MSERPDQKQRSTGADEHVEALIRDPDAREWIGAHLDDLRRSVSEHRYQRQTLWAGALAGLIAHGGGYLLSSAGLAEPLGLLSDLLYSLGLALWTGTVVVALTEVIPQAKERQVLAAIDAYEAAIRDEPGEPGN
jgi:hypothetical protein